MLNMFFFSVCVLQPNQLRNLEYGQNFRVNTMSFQDEKMKKKHLARTATCRAWILERAQK